MCSFVCDQDEVVCRRLYVRQWEYTVGQDLVQAFDLVLGPGLRLDLIVAEVLERAVVMKRRKRLVLDCSCLVTVVCQGHDLLHVGDVRLQGFFLGIDVDEVGPLSFGYLRFLVGDHRL